MEEDRIIGLGEPTEEEKKLIEAQDSQNPDEVDLDKLEDEIQKEDE